MAPRELRVGAFQSDAKGFSLLKMEHFLGSDMSAGETISAPLSDEELLARSCQQDQAAFEALVQAWSRRLYSLAWRIVGDTQQAEEVVQDAFFRIWNKACSYDPEQGRASSWMFAILHRLSLDRLRRNRARGAHLASPSADLAPWAPAATTLGDPWQKLRMQSALQTLSEAQRQVVMLAYYEGLSREEMAQRLGEPVGTVKTRLRDALVKLKKNFKDPAGELQSLERGSSLSSGK